jgi:hypothetical protein
MQLDIRLFFREKIFVHALIQTMAIQELRVSKIFENVGICIQRNFRRRSVSSKALGARLGAICKLVNS